MGAYSCYDLHVGLMDGRVPLPAVECRMEPADPEPAIITQLAQDIQSKLQLDDTALSAVTELATFVVQKRFPHKPALFGVGSYLFHYRCYYVVGVREDS